MIVTDLDKLVSKLPTCPGILGKDEFLNAAVCIPLVQIDQTYHLLFEKRADHIQQGGEICFPGGLFDPNKDKTLKQTAIRETMEEIGVSNNQISIIGQIGSVFTPMGATIDPFIGVLDIQTIQDLTIDQTEVNEVFLIPISFFQTHQPDIYQIRMIAQPFYEKNGKIIELLPAKALGLPEKYSKPWGGFPLNVYMYHFENRMIWGLTARIVREFIRLLDKAGS